MVTLPVIGETKTAISDEFGTGSHIKTTSLCPTCLARIPADVFERHSEIRVAKECPEHGRFSALLASDARHYHVADRDRTAFCLATMTAIAGCGITFTPSSGRLVRPVATTT